MLFKYRKIIIIIGIILVVITAIFAFIFTNQKQTPQKQEQNTTKLNNKLDMSVGGTIIQNGFEISYLETEQTYVIKVTNNPFQKNLNEAKNYIKSQGVNPEDLKYICAISQGVDVSEEEINKCGTAVIN